MAKSKYLHSLPDICELDTEEYDSALSSLEDLDSITDGNISYNQDEKLLYRSDGASENEIQLLKEIRYLKTELEGERAENQKYEKNIEILVENSKKDEKKLI